MEKVVRLEIKYDELLERIPYKYAIPVVVAKRAEAIREYAKPFVITDDENPVSIAFMELSKGYIRIKNEEILRALVPKVK
ncbi:DNA-directed RNA polymerase subunit omega [Thermotoga sp. KOL6]|uniref:DNA-directed RNA polymerase subunit omega n=1 Tax=Thermotoga sp. KOL6 TaxID=126741 RepID=UPI000C75D1D8|nr:DNA-directed RNA polymerase subunit omega [Thermotoga sp. KOL6]PLV60074.1 DNA-directed RNA polymerase subunit omega [Thermotoga sp. KOL6]